MMTMTMTFTQMASPRSPSHIMPVMKLRRLSPHCSPQEIFPSCESLLVINNFGLSFKKRGLCGAKYSPRSSCQFYNFVSGCQNIWIPLIAPALDFPKIFETTGQPFSKILNILISVDTYKSYVICIHSKSIKVCGFCFSVSKNLRKKCVNSDGIILRQKCVNDKNHENLVSMWYFYEYSVFQCFY